MYVCVCMVASAVWGNVYMHVCACVQEHSNSRRSPSRTHSLKWGLKLSSVCVKRARMCVCVCVCVVSVLSVPVLSVPVYVCVYGCECCVGKCVYACVCVRSRALELTSLTLPDTLTEVGTKAFLGLC